MWFWGRSATQHVGEARALGGMLQEGGLETQNPTASQCQAPGDMVTDSGLRECSALGRQSSRLSEHPLCARHSSEHFLGLNSSSSLHPRRWVL